MNGKNEGEVEVPFELYQQWCRRCSDREETLTPYEEILEQWTRLAAERNPVKIRCRAVNRCPGLKRK